MWQRYSKRAVAWVIIVYLFLIAVALVAVYFYQADLADLIAEIRAGIARSAR